MSRGETFAAGSPAYSCDHEMDIHVPDPIELLVNDDPRILMVGHTAW